MYSFTRVWIEVPTGQNAERHQESCEDHKQHGNAVNTHMVIDRTTEPFRPAQQTGIPSCRLIELPTQITERDKAKVIAVVQNATQRAFRAETVNTR